MKKLVLVAVVVAALSGSAVARADVVTDWNRTMIAGFEAAKTPPPPGNRIGAIVQASVYDAVNGIERRFTPYHVEPAAAPGASRAAAAASAAYTVGLAVAASAGTHNGAAALPPGNTVAQWNKIAEDIVVGSGTNLPEGFPYMAYVSAAVYDAVVPIEGSFEPYGPAITAPAGASADAAVVEAAYRTLWAYFPPEACNPASAPAVYAFCRQVRANLDALHTEALSAIPDGQAKADGQAVGLQAANDIITLRNGDGRMTPIGITSPFPTLPQGPVVWRLTPPLFLAPQTPWLANMRPFVLQSLDQFLPDPPPSLQSDEWVHAFNEIKSYGAANSSVRSDEQTAIAKFWSANTVRQYNRVGRDIAAARGLGLLDTARLAAMINLVGADALMSCFNAKYHYLLWRPVTAINGSLDPTAVTDDGFGPLPGYDDGNPATAEQPGWRPLLTTPNHPEYPAAHGVITSAMAEVFSSFLDTNQIDLEIHGFDPAGPAGNLNAVQHFDMPNHLRQQIIDARVWAGVHYRFSGVAGVVLGRKVAKYDLRHAFQPSNSAHRRSARGGAASASRSRRDLAGS